MRKIIIQGVIIIMLFFSAWYVLSQVDWVKHLKIQQKTDKTEQKFGELIWEFYKSTGEENKNTIINNAIDSIVTHICLANSIKRETVQAHVFNDFEINAFALPNGHLVINKGMLLNVENQEELTGVICHEIAHIEMNHIMKTLVKEIGLSAIISITTGNGGAEILKEAIRLFSSTAFDRKMEKEADIKAVDYLIKANVNPEPFANLLYRFSDTEHEATKYLTWISTHPDSKERAEYIVEYSKDKVKDFESILSETTWEKVKEKLEN